MNKYHAKKTVVDGVTFDSIMESRRYSFLKVLEKSGKISDLKLQPSFLLQEKFKFQGKWVRPIIYKADFSYVFNGELKIEDVKGQLNQIYLLKKKMLQFNYRDINFYEVYKENDLGGLV